MTKRFIVWVIALCLTGAVGCSKIVAPDRPIDQIKKEAETMSVADLEAHAKAYADALRAKKVEIDRIKEKMKAMPVQKIFDNSFLTKKIARIGREAGPLFDRYLVYVQKLQEKGADLSRVKLE